MNPYEIASLIYNTIKEMYPDSELNFYIHHCCRFGGAVHTDLVLKTADKSYLYINDRDNIYKTFIEELQIKDEKVQRESSSNKSILLQKKNED